MEEEPQEIIVEPDEEDLQTSSLYENAIGFISGNGWGILILAIVLWYLYKYVLEDRLQQYQQNRQNQTESAAHHRDPDAIYDRHLAMEASRRKLQEVHDKLANQYAEKQKQREEQKRQEKIKDWENHQKGQGYRSKAKVAESEGATATANTNKNKKPTTTLRSNDYNPLAGSSSGSGNFRSARRSFRGG